MTSTDKVYGDAIISEDEKYRYVLRRIWDANTPPLIFIMLNPSTADAREDDPTIRRCTSFALREGAGGIVVINLFAYRTSKPSFLVHDKDPVGPRNAVYWTTVFKSYPKSKVVAAWGADPIAEAVREQYMVILKERNIQLYCLGTSKHGAPRHPLYLPKGSELVEWHAPE